MPYRVTGTQTSITLKWQIPADNGGCPITSFSLFRDDGSAGSITTEVDPQNINHKPALTEYTVGNLETGKQFRFQI